MIHVATYTHSARALATVGRNNYIPPAQESHLILPDGFSVLPAGHETNLNCKIGTA